MSRLLACILMAALGTGYAGAGDHHDRAQYVGGTIAELPRTGGVMDTTGERALRFRSGRAELEIPYDNINLLEYGQRASRRYAMAVVISPLLLLSKQRKHFLTIGYTDEEGKQQAVVFRVDKDHIRAVLVSLEARTGLKVEYQDPEARKSGKG